MFTESDAGKTVEVRINEQFSIELSATPGTGYTWELAAPVEPVLQKLGEAKFKGDERNLPGSGGSMVFEFAAVQTGKSRVELVYRRVWETTAKPARVFQLNVVVVEVLKG
jgi:predicted secreted protein